MSYDHSRSQIEIFGEFKPVSEEAAFLASPNWLNRVTLAVRRSLLVYPQLRTCRCTAVTDALCQQVTYAPQQGLLFDHLVGTGEQRWWHREAECLGSFEVDTKLELGRQLNGKFGCLCAMQDAINVVGRTPE